MKLATEYLQQLDAEAVRTRRVLEAVPDGRDDWQPHPRSMPLGRLAMLVAGMPSWFALIVRDESLDLKPVDGPHYRPPPMRNREERVSALDEALAKGRQALQEADEEHLMKPWRLLEAGRVVSEQPRHIVIQDTFMHLAHHRGQLTVYLRLNDVRVPAVYGPSADDSRYD